MTKKNRAKLPVAGKRNVLVTSALPYCNNVPHLGNIVGSVLSADVYARFRRLLGDIVLFMCGTDEYGTATETKALQENCTPQQICDKYHAIHKGVYEWFGISFDKFGRTSTPEQTEICQAIFNKLLENNFLSDKKTQQLYCDTCSKFLADRLVEGGCPTCTNESAAGDQCDDCRELFASPAELINPRCKVCGTSPQIRDTEHVFLELPLLEPKLREYIEKMSVEGSWSENAITTTDAWFKKNLQHRSITRDLKWGVPVPLEKFKDKVFYVWFDAPIGYISITKCYTEEWEKWWKNPENVELYQFMGKDNIPFHTVMFPSTLIGTGESWTMMKTISCTEYLNYEKGCLVLARKFSKSKGVGVFGNDAKDTGIPVEVWRYYLLANRPEGSDTTFEWSQLRARNTELINNPGNCIYRVLSFIAKPGYNSVIPDAPGADSHTLTKEFAENHGNLFDEYVKAMEKVKLKDGLRLAMEISSLGNKYLQDSKFWKLYKEDRPSCSIIMRTAAGVVYILACLLEPFMPSFSAKVLKQLNMPLPQSISDEDFVVKTRRPWEIIPAGHKIGTPAPIFTELTQEQVEFFRHKFAGSQADRADRAVKEEAEAKKDTEKLNTIKRTDEGGKEEVPSKDSVKAKTQAAAEQELTISRLDIRVGVIKEVQKHPDADSLYVEKIDVGEEQLRTVVSGLVRYIPLGEMQNRKVCVLCNLKPATMRGIKSHAMVLCASTSDKVELVEPPASSVIGERVTFSGFNGEPDNVLNPKKKIWETLQADLHTDKNLVACYKDIPFTTSAGVCKVLSISDGTIR